MHHSSVNNVLQTWKNENDLNCERGWLLMASCLSAFPPSKMLHKYLLKYASDHAYNGYKYVCQQKLIKAGKLGASHPGRRFPPTLLEWRANRKRVNMCLAGVCADGRGRSAHVQSLMTASEFAAVVLSGRGVPEAELKGWTVLLEEGDTAVEVNGGEFVLDVIGETEIPPAFPGLNNDAGTDVRSSFFVTKDR